MRKRSVPQVPTYDEERFLFDQGYSLVAGMDEVGRGPLAGPVVAGLAILPSDPQGESVDLIRDSIVDLGLGLVRLEQGRRRLEELFQPQASLEEEEGARG